MKESDLFQLFPVTHHQKFAVFDQETLYIGGLDLDERRYDTKDHDRAAEQTWQDVQVTVRGPVVDAAWDHLNSFESVVAAKCDPAPAADGFLRTLSTKRWPSVLHISPKTLVTEIEDAHLRAVSQAHELIYLETQFLRHLPLAEALARQGRQQPDLRLIIDVPAAPEDVAFEENTGRDARLGEQLQADAMQCIQDGFGDRVLICSPAQRRPAFETDARDTLGKSPIVYVHSKVSIFDDAQAIVSSANLNGRSLRWDTEAGIHLTRTDHVQQLRARIFDHWMPNTGTAPAQNLLQLFEDWRDRVWSDVNRAPKDRRCRLLPYDITAAEKLGKAAPFVPNELV